MRSLPFLLPALALALVGCGQDPVTSGTTTTGAGATSSSGTGGGGGAPPGQVLKVLDWNAHNFYDDVDDPDLPNETGQQSGEMILSSADYDTKRQGIAAVIAELDPDVIVFAEVENESLLQDLNAELGGAYLDLQVPTGNDPRGLDVAAMSKITFDSVVQHNEDTFVLQGTNAPTYSFARDVPEFHLTFNGRSIVLLGIHYRSKGPPDDADKRLAEAQQTRVIADGLTAADPELGVIILGDSNDVPGSYPVEALVGAEPNLYTDAADSLPTQDRWTFDYMGTQELIDHQMSNPVLTPMLDPASVTIPHGQNIDDLSDHAPIFASYTIQ